MTERSRAKTWVLRIAGGLAGLGLLAFCVAYASFRSDPQVEALPEGLPAEVTVAAVPADLPKQGTMECGAFSLSMVLRCQGQEATPQAMIPVVWHEGPVRFLSGTLPWRIRAELERRGLTGQAYTAREAPAERRLDMIRKHLAKQRPVILLVESERGTQHWIVALGYGPKGIDVYDPNHTRSPTDDSQTEDTNGSRPGNRTLDDAYLLGLWSRGGGGGLYTWWYLPVGERPKG